MLDCIRKSYKSDGFVGFYRGISASILGIFLYKGFYFGIFDIGRSLLFSSETNMFYIFLLAQFVTFFAGVITYPLDTIMNRLIMQTGRQDKMYTGLINCYNVISKNEGMRGFYKGFSIKIISGIGSAFVLLTYDRAGR